MSSSGIRKLLSNKRLKTRREVEEVLDTLVDELGIVKFEGLRDLVVNNSDEDLNKKITIVGTTFNNVNINKREKEKSVASGKTRISYINEKIKNVRLELKKIKEFDDMLMTAACMAVQLR